MKAIYILLRYLIHAKTSILYHFKFIVSANITYQITRRFFFTVLFISVSLLNCVYTFKIRNQYSPPALDRKVPKTVYVYISPGVCKYLLERTRGKETRQYEFGEAICDGIENMFKGIFSNVTISNTDEFPKENIYDYIIKPEIAPSDFLFASSVFYDKSTVISIKYSVYDPEGNCIWFDTYRGESRFPSTKFHVCLFPCYPFAIWYGIRSEWKESKKSMSEALEDHFKKAYAGMMKNGWWK